MLSNIVDLLSLCIGIVLGMYLACVLIVFIRCLLRLTWAGDKAVRVILLFEPCYCFEMCVLFTHFAAQSFRAMLFISVQDTSSQQETKCNKSENRQQNLTTK